MDTIYVVQLTADGEGITDFQFGNAVVTFTTRFNYTVGAWSLDIADADGVLMVAGILLIPGVSLLQPYADLTNLIGDLVIFELNVDDYMNPELLGTNVQMVWYPLGTPEADKVLQYV